MKKNNFPVVARISEKLDSNHFTIEVPKSQSKKIKLNDMFSLDGDFRW